MSAIALGKRFLETTRGQIVSLLRRGVRTAVCEKTFRLLGQMPYRDLFDFIEPRVPVATEDAPPFPCAQGTLIRDPRETKGEGYSATTEAASCGPGTGCC